MTIPDRGDLAGSPKSGPATIPDRDESTQSPTSGPATIPDCDNHIRIPKIDLDADQTIPKQIEGGKTHAQGNATSSAKQTSKLSLDEQLHDIQTLTFTQFDDDSLTVQMSTIDINGKSMSVKTRFENVPLDEVIQRLPRDAKEILKEQGQMKANKCASLD